MTLMAQRQTPMIDWRDVPRKHRGRVSAVCRSIGDCQDLVAWFGSADFCPFQPILLLIPEHPTLLVGLGYATASELRDDAVNLWGKYTERLRKTGSLVNFDELREKARLPRHEDVKALTQEAFAERIRQHRANPITDPAREPLRPRVAGKTVHTVAKIGEQA